mmetsp:Transcript_19959/g.56314  ORF Transcript_19959/g.56314 Transcript_19959/m.56314 type:complete len:320 (-) Transcript_19959:786-1745(-)
MSGGIGLRDIAWPLWELRVASFASDPPVALTTHLHLTSPTHLTLAPVATLRWVESSLGLPVWLPVSLMAYEQFSQAALRAVNTYSSAAQRDAVLPFVNGNADALKKLTQVLIAAHLPSDLEKRTLRGLSALLGAPLVEAHWERLSPAGRTWLCRVLFFLPAVPWGREGWRDTEAARASSKPPNEDGTAPTAVLELELLCLEMLVMARPLHALFDDSSEDGRKASARNSVLPYQPHAPDTCPYPPHPADGPGGSEGVARYSALLLLLAPVRPQDVAKSFPQVSDDPHRRFLGGSAGSVAAGCRLSVHELGAGCRLLQRTA